MNDAHPLDLAHDVTGLDFVAVDHVMWSNGEARRPGWRCLSSLSSASSIGGCLGSLSSYACIFYCAQTRPGGGEGGAR